MYRSDGVLVELVGPGIAIEFAILGIKADSRIPPPERNTPRDTLLPPLFLYGAFLSSRASSGSDADVDQSHVRRSDTVRLRSCIRFSSRGDGDACGDVGTILAARMYRS